MERPLVAISFYVAYSLRDVVSDKTGKGGSASEGHGPYHSHRNRFAVETSGSPFGHFAEHADGFFVERGLDASQNRDMRHRTVGVDHKSACDATLNTFFVSFLGILAVGIDEFHQIAVAAGEGRLVGDIVVFENFHIAGAAGGVCADIDAAGLGMCSISDEEYGACD